MAGATLGAKRPGSSLVGTASRRRNEALVRFVAHVGRPPLDRDQRRDRPLPGLPGAPVFVTSIDLGQLVAPGWFPRRGQFDLLTLIVGTVIVALIAMLLAGPIGLAAAIYLSEYASPRTRKIIKPILEILAGIPSVVLGFFALTWISPNVVQAIFPTAQGFNFMAAAIGRRDPHDPARGLHLRGRHAGRPARRSGRPPTASARGGSRRRCGWSCPPRSPGSWPP